MTILLGKLWWLTLRPLPPQAAHSLFNPTDVDCFVSFLQKQKRSAPDNNRLQTSTKGDKNLKMRPVKQ